MRRGREISRRRSRGAAARAAGPRARHVPATSRPSRVRCADRAGHRRRHRALRRCRTPLRRGRDGLGRSRAAVVGHQRSGRSHAREAPVDRRLGRSEVQIDLGQQLVDAHRGDGMTVVALAGWQHRGGAATSMLAHYALSRVSPMTRRPPVPRSWPRRSRSPPPSSIGQTGATPASGFARSTSIPSCLSASDPGVVLGRQPGGLRGGSGQRVHARDHPAPRGRRCPFAS
jgi:hypothetical protein